MRKWTYIRGSETSDTYVMQSDDGKFLVIGDAEYEPTTGKLLKKTSHMELTDTSLLRKKE